MLALAVFAAHQLRRELTAVLLEWPDVELLVEDEPQPDYAYSDILRRGQALCEHLHRRRPAFPRQARDRLLLRPLAGIYRHALYAGIRTFRVIRAPSDTEYLSISCSQGGLDKGPLLKRLAVPPFDRNRGEAAAASRTTARRCCLRQRTGRRSRSRSTADLSRIYEPELDCVYVCRSVWQRRGRARLAGDRGIARIGVIAARWRPAGWPRAYDNRAKRQTGRPFQGCPARFFTGRFQGNSGRARKNFFSHLLFL